jgi:hypothetical protein
VRIHDAEKTDTAMPRRSRIVPLILMLLPACMAQADTLVESTSSVNGPQTLAVANGQVRIEPARTGAPAMLFDARKGRLVLLNRPARQYNVITVDRLNALETRILEQRERLQRSMEDADDSERQRLQRRLERLPRVGANAAIRIDTSVETTRVNGLDCEAATAWEGGQRTHSLCISPVGTLGLSDATATTLRELFDFLARLRNLLGSGSAPFDARLLQATLSEAGAFPVRIERLDDGTDWTVRAIQTVDIPAERFEVPEDFSEGARLGGE